MKVLLWGIEKLKDTARELVVKRFAKNDETLEFVTVPADNAQFASICEKHHPEAVIVSGECYFPVNRFVALAPSITFVLLSSQVAEKLEMYGKLGFLVK